MRNTRGSWHSLWLSDIGNAAARETLLTATPQFSAIWTGLFHELLTADSQLCWLGNGPGIGRDARIAYSGLLGRYFARAHLEVSENVRVLVPVDVIRGRLSASGYRVRKSPPGRGLEADWIGLDRRGLVIAEAKGSFNEGVGIWRGPYSVPDVLRTAMAQAGRTAVFSLQTGLKLSAKRWAIASRWATEQNSREPTMLAWDPEEEGLREDDYVALAEILHGADLSGVMIGLGHSATLEMLRTAEPSRRVVGDISLNIGGHTIEPGFAALMWPGGVQALRGNDDVVRIRRLRDLNEKFAVVSLSTKYATNILRNPLWVDGGEESDTGAKKAQGSRRFSRRAGLSVMWPEADDEIVVLGD